MQVAARHSRSIHSPRRQHDGAIRSCKLLQLKEKVADRMWNVVVVVVVVVAAAAAVAAVVVCCCVVVVVVVVVCLFVVVCVCVCVCVCCLSVVCLRNCC